MKKITTLITFLLLFQISFAQQSRFSKIYFDNIGSFSAKGMAKSYDGGLIVCGLYNYGSAVMKIDSLGAIVWANQIGFGSNESFNSIVRTTDSCFVMAGKVYNSTSGYLDINIAKIDQAGNLIWSKAISGSTSQEALAMDLTIDGGFILTGYESNLIAPYSRIFVTKLDSNADVQWHKVFQAGNNANYGSAVKQTPDSGFAIVGYVENYPPYDANGFLCKLSSTGTVEWTNRYNTTIPTQFWGNDLVVASDGIYSFYSASSGFVLVKTDYNGTDNWKELISGISASSGCGNCITSKMKLLPDGNIIFASGVGMDGFAMSTSFVSVDSAGSFNWSQNLQNSVHDVEQADDHGLFFLGNGPLIGVRTTTITNPHVGIIKADSLGNADLCTSPNPFISIIYGTITQGTYIFNVVSPVVTSTLISPNVAAFSLSEQVSCVDIIGGINDESINAIKLYPNPTGSALSIQLPGIAGEVDLKIIDVLGQIVFTNKYNLSNENEIKIDQAFAKGVYSVMINSGDKKIVGKFVVQ